MEKDVFRAIADPTRRKIIDLLADRSMPVNKVADHFEISRPAVSKHLKILNGCGLVRIREDGRKRFCRADPRKLQEVMEWTARYSRFWADSLDTLEALLENDDESEDNLQ